MSMLTRFDLLLDLLRQMCRTSLRWLRRDRWKKTGELAPVIVTEQGVAVESVSRVPVRSTKADAKRRALAFARHHFNDPTMTWGQARKRIRQLEREARVAGVDIGEMAVGGEE